MPSNPTTKSQVQAYRFVLRRMQSALVRRDAVMVHDPLRTQNRATMVGVIVAVIGLLGFLIVGILRPTPQPPGTGIVIGKESGQVYVKIDDPFDMLIPTFNLASARLILMAQGEGGDDGVVDPSVVPDSRLEDIPRGRPQGIPDGPPLLPGKDQGISDHWAVCNDIDAPTDLTDAAALEQAVQQTAVLAGVSDLGRPLGKDESILVQRGDGAVYLIYRPEEDPNRSYDMVMARVPMEDPKVRSALNLDGQTPRPMSLGVLNAIEEVDALDAPRVPKAGQPTDFDLGGEVGTGEVGDVFWSAPGGTKEFYVLLEDGRQRVTEAVASLVRSEYSGTHLDIPGAAPDRVAAVPNTQNPLQVDQYPAEIPTVLDMLGQYSTTCLGWELVGEGENKDGRTTMYVGGELPFPRDDDGNRKRPIRVGKANEEGIAVNFFYMPPGRAAAIHAATGKASFKSGPIQLISDRGMRYGIPNQRTAVGLGLNNLRPAPESIIKLLPTAASLNVQDAMRTFETLTVEQASSDFDGQGLDDEG